MISSLSSAPAHRGICEPREGLGVATPGEDAASFTIPGGGACSWLRCRMPRSRSTGGIWSRWPPDGDRCSATRHPRSIALGIPRTSSASGAGSAWSLRHGSCQPATHHPPIEDRARQEAVEQAEREAEERSKQEAQERARQMAEEQTVLPHLCLHPGPRDHHIQPTRVFSTVITRDGHRALVPP
jgi:hypothetical protein